MDADHLRYRQLYFFDRDMNRTEDKYGWLAASAVRTARAHRGWPCHQHMNMQKGPMGTHKLTLALIDALSFSGDTFLRVPAVTALLTDLVLNYLHKFTILQSWKFFFLYVFEN